MQLSFAILKTDRVHRNNPGILVSLEQTINIMYVSTHIYIYRHVIYTEVIQHEMNKPYTCTWFMSPKRSIFPPVCHGHFGSLQRGCAVKSATCQCPGKKQVARFHQSIANPSWLWFKNRYPKWLALVNRTQDQNLRSPGGLILTHIVQSNLATSIGRAKRQRQQRQHWCFS